MMDHDRQAEIGQDAQELAMTLHRLLEEQLTAGRAGNLSRMDQLGEQANEVLAKIVRLGGDMPGVLGPLRRDLERLYNELTLLLRTQQVDVHGKLKQLRQVKRALGAYKLDIR